MPVIREPTVLDAGAVFEPPQPEEAEPFEPVVLRSVARPNHKILQIDKTRLPDGRWRAVTHQPIQFVNTYYRCTERRKYETVMQRMKGIVFEEPRDETAEPFRYFENGRVLFSTRNRHLYEAFVQKMQS